MIRYGLVLCCLAALPLAAQERVTDGLLLLYRFDETDGDLIEDQSGGLAPVDLFVGDLAATRWEAGALHLLQPTIVLSDTAPRRVAQALQLTNALTLEAWITPDDLNQTGPARVVTMSSDPHHRNLTLGQERDRWSIRLRTTASDENGTNPELWAPVTAEPALSHIVFTRDRDGVARFYVDGVLRDERELPGDFRGWDPGYRLALGNEVEDDRTWLGDLHLAAVYEQALTPEQVAAHRAAGRAVLGTDDVPDLPVPPLALYTFAADEGDRVLDRSGVEPALDLLIADPERVTRQAGMIRLNSSTRLVSAAPASKLTDACWITGELSVELWCRPRSFDQTGPARMFTLSRDGGQRNWTIGQENDTLVARLRTPATGPNGTTGQVNVAQGLTAGPCHIAFTRDIDGTARIYLNGKLATEASIAGTLANWDESMLLAVGNELTEDRPWRGRVHLVALYDRALDELEIARNAAATP